MKASFGFLGPVRQFIALWFVACLAGITPAKAQSPGDRDLPATLRLLFPLPGITLTPGAARFEAVAVDPDGPPLTVVEFLVDDVVVSTSDRSGDIFPTVLGLAVPHKGAWPNPAAGVRVLRARALVDKKVVAETAAIRVTVRDSILPPPPNPTLKVALTSPTNRFVAPAGQPIVLSAEVSSTEPVVAVEFVALGVGMSRSLGTVAKAPWTFTWETPPAGMVTLVARARTASARAESTPVVGHFSRVPTSLPLVSLVATHPATTEPAPHIRIRPGAFTVTRKGDLSAPLRVLYAVGGTASNGRDYDVLDGDITLGAGEASAEIQVIPVDDGVPEPDETVVLRLRPDAAYGIAEPSSATVTIHDTTAHSSARLDWVAPKAGSTFTAPADINLSLVAVDPNGYIAEVEFLANGRPIGKSTLNFIRAPDPGTPIEHGFAWAKVPAGLHIVTATAKDPAGTIIRSQPLMLVVRTAIEPPQALRHPADVDPADNLLSEAEVQTYAKAWRAGPATDARILPVAYVTRAGFLWKAGGPYRHEPLAGPLPLAWVSTQPGTEPVPGRDFLPPLLPGNLLPDLNGEIPPRLPLNFLVAEAPVTPSANGIPILLRTGPIPGTRCQAFEVRLGPGSRADEISEDGVFDSNTATLRWGPFHDDTPRKLSARITTPTLPIFRAVGSYDGRDVYAARVLPIIPTPGADPAPRIVTVESLGNGGVQIVVIDDSQDPGAESEIEVSTDLVRWTRIARLPAGAEAAASLDGDAGNSESRFYRAVRRVP